MTRGPLLLAVLALVVSTGATSVAQQNDDGSSRIARPGQEDALNPAPDRPEQIVAGMSQDAVSITTSFNGSEILIYGAVKREAPVPPGNLGVIVTVEGPSRAVTIRRMERKLGVWVNTEAVDVGAAPEFYAVATSGRLRSMLRPEQDTRYRISPALALRAFAGPVAVTDVTSFTEALVRLRENAGEYRLDQRSVRIVDDTLFRADIRLPANLVEGTYKSRIFLVRDGYVVDTQTAPIEVRKVGLERWLYHLAMNRPFWYGILSLAIAVGAGWTASVAFRIFKRT